eukprot:TRINITY_DN4942_c1_g1_i8.p1 TRINITY_DN4942_c1_g1~~TRINITY_DN4942_c1_g1_i8.p1  ORF type:complete len:274 (-),score=103.18 TRINITY_DN4942_c1_g1_i8:49-789(-)
MGVEEKKTGTLFSLLSKKNNGKNSAEDLKEKLQKAIELKRKNREGNEQSKQLPNKRMKKEDEGNGNVNVSNEIILPSKDKQSQSSESKKTNRKERKIKKTQKEESEKENSDLEENIQFGLFEFGEDKPKPAYLSKKENASKLKVNRKALEKLKREEQLLSELSGTKEGQELSLKKSWNTVFERAQGNKVKDDVQKLTKSVKKKEWRKEKSRKTWSERQQTIKSEQEEKQKKRKDNSRKHQHQSIHI